MGDIDMGILRLQIDGVDIDEFVGCDNVSIGGQTQFSEAPGEVVLGLMRTTKSNKISFNFAIRQTSKKLWEKVIPKAINEVDENGLGPTITVYIADEDQNIIADGEFIKIEITDAGLNHSNGTVKGASPGDWTFQALGGKGSIQTKNGSEVLINPPTDA